MYVLGQPASVYLKLAVSLRRRRCVKIKDTSKVTRYVNIAQRKHLPRWTTLFNCVSLKVQFVKRLIFESHFHLVKQWHFGIVSRAGCRPKVTVFDVCWDVLQIGLSKVTAGNEQVWRFLVTQQCKSPVVHPKWLLLTVEQYSTQKHWIPEPSRHWKKTLASLSGTWA